MSRTNNEWPKEWKEVLPEKSDDEEYFFSTKYTWTNIGEEGRFYDGTFYVTPTFGDEDGSADTWMPFSEYLREQIKEESKKLNEEFANEVVQNV